MALHRLSFASVLCLLESLRLFLPTFTLSSVLEELKRWWATGQSCIEKLVAKLELTPPEQSVIDQVLSRAEWVNRNAVENWQARRCLDADGWRKRCQSTCARTPQRGPACISITTHAKRRCRLEKVSARSAVRTGLTTTA
jgi:hypothetical protein